MESGKLMEVRNHIFNGKEFQIIKGTTHPEYSFFTFEGEERDFRDKHWGVKDGDVVFDVGASYGTYTLSACSMGATVFSFEPEKTVFKDLVNNIAINDWNDKSYLFNFGLWDIKSRVNMKSYAPHWPEATITSDYEMETLDSISDRYDLKKIDWMKIDVEGAEVKVITGGLNSIKKFLPNLIIECHTFLDPAIKDQVISLLSNEYDFEEVDRPPCVMLLGKPKKEV
jgi:FkbM family methyltransferase